MAEHDSLILEELGFVGWEYASDERFSLVGEIPEWWKRLFAAGSSAYLLRDLDSDFVDNFLIDAKELWSGPNDGKIESGVWEFESPQGGYLLIQIHAIKSGDSHLLVFQDLDATDDIWRNLLQSGRQNQLNLLRDISLRKQLELELRRAKENAERLERAKMEFYAKTNHEIRTPLTSILAMMDLALETELTSQQREYVEATQKSAETLLRIMNDVLDFSKIEHGSLSIECTKFSVAEMLSELERDFQPAAAERGITFETSLDIEDDTLHTDAVRLRQVLNNLVHNALRFTDLGGVAVTVSNHRQPAIVNFAVRDTGCGIPADQQQKIFDSFIQGDRDAGLQRGGTGLGLSIASKLVKLMKGDALHLSSEPGVGTTFSFGIPRRLDQTSSSKPAQSSVVGADVGLLCGRTVLVAEDNPVNRSYACHILKNAGMTVLEAEDGNRAIELTQQHRPDIALMDCRMPECDGIQAADRIRALEREANSQRLPIVAVTAHAMEEDVERCMKAGMDDYISKPFKKNDLLHKMASLLSPSPAGGRKND